MDLSSLSRKQGDFAIKQGEIKRSKKIKLADQDKQIVKIGPGKLLTANGRNSSRTYKGERR